MKKAMKLFIFAAALLLAFGTASAELEHSMSMSVDLTEDNRARIVESYATWFGITIPEDAEFKPGRTLLSSSGDKNTHEAYWCEITDADGNPTQKLLAVVTHTALSLDLHCLKPANDVSALSDFELSKRFDEKRIELISEVQAATNGSITTLSPVMKYIDYYIDDKDHPFVRWDCIIAFHGGDSGTFDGKIIRLSWAAETDMLCNVRISDFK